MQRLIGLCEARYPQMVEQGQLSGLEANRRIAIYRRIVIDYDRADEKGRLRHTQQELF